MNVLSLFDGISCGRAALDRAGIPVTEYFASEIDKWAIQISKKNYPDIIHVGDVQTVHKSFLPEIDLLIGGSPCQGFSAIGKQLNFNDDRSKLFFEYVRLKKELKPKWFLLENVAMKKEWQEIISDFIGTEPVEINSARVSAQYRKRLYWTNIPFSLPDVRGPLLDSILQDNVSEKYTSSPGPAGPRTGVIKNRGKYYIRNQKAMCLDANYFKGVDNHGQRTLIRERGRYRRLTPVECERLQTLPDNYTEGVSDTQRYKMLGNGWTVDVIAHILRGIK